MDRDQINELKRRRKKLVDEARGLLDRAEGEDRDLTAEEQQQYDRLMAEVDTLGGRIARAERQLEAEGKLERALPNPVAPARPGEEPQDEEERAERPRASTEYRRAFWGYVRRSLSGLFPLQYLSQLLNPAVVTFSLHVSNAIWPGGTLSDGLPQPPGQVSVLTVEKADHVRKTLNKAPLSSHRVPDEMPDTQRWKRFALIPVNQTGAAGRTLVSIDLATNPGHLLIRQLKLWRGGCPFFRARRTASCDQQYDGGGQPQTHPRRPGSGWPYSGFHYFS